MDERELREFVTERLTFRGREICYEFEISDNGVYRDDDWWHVIVEPLKDIRAYKYADVLAAVEEEAQEKFGKNILLVPAVSSKSSG